MSERKQNQAYWVFTIHDGYISFRTDSGYTGSTPFAVIPGGTTPLQKAHAYAKWVKLKRSQYEVLDDRTHKNPRPRIGTAKPSRPSSATGKRPPKRLVSRRKANTRKGYFPNPAEVARAHNPIGSLRKGQYYVVEMDDRDGGGAFGYDVVTPQSWRVRVVTTPPRGRSYKLPPELYEDRNFIEWARRYAGPKYNLIASAMDIKNAMRKML